MAINAAVVWNVQTDGSQTNGGGFKAGASGTDYSKQAAAQWGNEAVTSAGAGTTMLTANAAATMVGNTLYVVSGTNATVGWYEITSVSVGVSITTDRNWCTGAVADGVVNIGGAFLIGGSLDHNFLSGLTAGNTVYIKSGTYTLGESFTSKTGSSTAPVSLIGYNSSHGDCPTGTDRPLLDGGATYTLTAGSYNKWSFLRATTAANWSTIQIGANSMLFGCGVAHTGTNASQRAIYTSGSGIVIMYCDVTAPRNQGIYYNGDAIVVGCYIHDCNKGIYAPGAYTACFGSIIETCQTGIDIAGGDGQRFYHCVIRNCVTGITATTGYADAFINNIIADCVTGASWGTAEPINYWDYNIWYNNGTDVSNVTKGPNAIATDPMFGSSIVEGADGVTDAGGTVFTAASNPFSGVTTDDCLNIVEAGTGATLGVYAISSVDGVGQLTLSRSAGASKTGIDYKVIKGADFTLETGSSALNAGVDAGTYGACTT